MKHINKYSNSKWIIIILFITILLVATIIILLNINLRKTYNVVLSVDDEGEYKLIFKNSNLNLISDSKSLYLKIENQEFFLENIELNNIGNNVYIVDFDNEALKDYLTPNSIFEVQLITSSKKLFDVIFNV